MPNNVREEAEKKIPSGLHVTFLSENDRLWHSRAPWAPRSPRETNHRRVPSLIALYYTGGLKKKSTSYLYAKAYIL